MQTTRRLKYEPDPNKFDLRTHEWDGQGKLIGTNHYRAYIVDGNKYYERPVNSGNLWFENNKPAGRVECKFNDKGHITSKRFNFEAAHISYTPPLTGAEKLHYELEQERHRSAQLEAELSAIRKEAQVRTTPKTPVEAADKVVEGAGETKKTAPTLTKRG